MHHQRCGGKAHSAALPLLELDPRPDFDMSDEQLLACKAARAASVAPPAHPLCGLAFTLTGKAGAGKSTVINEICREVTEA